MTLSQREITASRLSPPQLRCLCAAPGLFYLRAYPSSVLVFDEGKGQIVDRIPLVTGLPCASVCRRITKKIYVTTIDHNGIEVIDVADAQSDQSLCAQYARPNIYRFYGGTPDPRASSSTRSQRKSASLPRAL